LYIVAPINPIPPVYPRNQPLSPVRFGVTTNPRDIGSTAAAWNWHEVNLVATLWTTSRQAAERVREKTEALLCDDDVLIRGAWYNMGIADLLSLMRFAASLCFVDVFTEEERQGMLQQAIAETIRRERGKVGVFA
jgi:hypothetical protein